MRIENNLTSIEIMIESFLQVTYYERINGACCTDPDPIEPFSSMEEAKKWCDKAPDCMYIYSETRSEDELFPCLKGHVVKSGSSTHYVEAKGKI